MVDLENSEGWVLIQQQGSGGNSPLDTEGFPEFKVTFMPGFRMFKIILAAITMGT